MKDLKFSILMPTYNGGQVIAEVIRGILHQSFINFELIIQMDGSIDDTEQIVCSFQDKRIKFYKNPRNLGYSNTLKEGIKHCHGDIVFLMWDDILAKDALFETYKAFTISEDIGAVTRPYYWFMDDVKTPVRVKKQLNPEKNEVVRIMNDPKKVIGVFKSLDQLSGLAYRVKYIDIPFHEDCFTAHVYPFASIFKKHPVVFLKDFTVAVRIGGSQTRTISSIYDTSPMKSWVDMFNAVFYEPEFIALRDFMIKNFVAVNYVGLVQIRNYSRYKYLLKEVWYLLKYRWQNLFSFQFWFFSLGCLIIPPILLIPLVDWYKNKVISGSLKHINFEYEL